MIKQQPGGGGGQEIPARPTSNIHRTVGGVRSSCHIMEATTHSWAARGRTTAAAALCAKLGSIIPAVTQDGGAR